MQHQQQGTSCVITSRLLNAIQKWFGQKDKNATDPNLFHSRTVKKTENMDFCKLLVYLNILVNPSQESVVPTEFLEAFITAQDRHSTVVITEKNSGTYNEWKNILL